MKIPGILFSSMSLLDIIFNFFLIYPTTRRTVLGFTFTTPGFGLGVIGAALGTCLAWSVSAVIMLIAAAFFNDTLKIRRSTTILVERSTAITTTKLAVPLALKECITSGALVMTTKIVAPLGNAAIAANSFATTAESFCYMPAYGMNVAASTAVGQCVGARRIDLAKQFSRTIITMSMILMVILGVIMFFICPFVFAFLTPDLTVRVLATSALRHELFSEPFYGAAIVSEGALRGAGDTVAPGIMSLISLWAVRVPLSFLLVGRFGLDGIWIAMGIELTFRGIIFMTRVRKARWEAL